jgi:hypothetical protein
VSQAKQAFFCSSDWNWTGCARGITCLFGSADRIRTVYILDFRLNAKGHTQCGHQHQLISSGLCIHSVSGFFVFVFVIVAPGFDVLLLSLSNGLVHILIKHNISNFGKDCRKYI